MPAKGQMSDTVLPHLCVGLLLSLTLSTHQEFPSQRKTWQMNFDVFELGLAAAFFVSSLILLNFGRHLGLRYLQQQKGAGSMAGLTTVEGAVFALIGLLLAFTISGALQRFDERRQMVIQEANAVIAAASALGRVEG